MPVVRISDTTFADISTLKTWFKTKSPSETIDRVVRDSMERLGIEHDDEIEESTLSSTNGDLVFDSAPSLTFTKPEKATIKGQIIQKPKWNTILHAMIAQVKSNGLKGDQLIRELGIPAKSSNHDRDGFKYVPALGISVQGQSAVDAWKEINRLANKWSIPVTVEFYWRQNPKAQHPGKKGILHSGSTKS